MKVENGVLIMELRPCWDCGGSRIAKRNKPVTCTNCKGTGKVGRKRCNVCISNRGSMYVPTTIPCPTCNQQGSLMEDESTYISEELWKSLNFKVFRSGRPKTFSEGLIGVIGSVCSVTDYGRHKDLTDEQLITQIREEQRWGIQVRSIANKEYKLCDYIGIFTNNSGYLVQAVYGGDNEAAAIEEDLKAQLPMGAGIAIGSRLAGEGLNGTMLAAAYRKPKRK